MLMMTLFKQQCKHMCIRLCGIFCVLKYMSGTTVESEASY